MAFHGPVSITAGTPAQLNATAVTALTVINSSPFPITLVGTATAAAPANKNGGLTLNPGEVLLSNVELAALWPGIAAAFVWAICGSNVEVQVSHA